jgi:hypothetical protein
MAGANGRSTRSGPAPDHAFLESIVREGGLDGAAASAIYDTEPVVFELAAVFGRNEAVPFAEELINAFEFACELGERASQESPNA